MRKKGNRRKLVAQCESPRKTYNKLAEGKVYCLAEPDHAGCKEIINAAEARQFKDRILWNECRTLGEKKFNAKYAGTPEKQRSEDCAMVKRTEQAGRTAKGRTGESCFRERVGPQPLLAGMVPIVVTVTRCLLEGWEPSVPRS